MDNYRKGQVSALTKLAVLESTEYGRAAVGVPETWDQARQQMAMMGKGLVYGLPLLLGGGPAAGVGALARMGAGAATRLGLGTVGRGLLTGAGDVAGAMGRGAIEYGVQNALLGENVPDGLAGGALTSLPLGILGAGGRLVNKGRQAWSSWRAGSNAAAHAAPAAPAAPAVVNAAAQPSAMRQFAAGLIPNAAMGGGISWLAGEDPARGALSSLTGLGVRSVASRPMSRLSGAVSKWKPWASNAVVGGAGAALEGVGDAAGLKLFGDGLPAAEPAEPTPDYQYGEGAAQAQRRRMPPRRDVAGVLHSRRYGVAGPARGGPTPQGRQVASGAQMAHGGAVPYDPMAHANRARALAAKSKQWGQFSGPVGTTPFQNPQQAQTFLANNRNFARLTR